MAAKKGHARLLWKLYAGFLLVACSGVLVAGILVDRNVQRSSRVQVEERLDYEATMLSQMTANALFGELDPTDTTLSTEVRSLAEAVHTHLTLIAKNGTVVADSDAPAGSVSANQGDAPEISAARATGLGVSARAGRTEPEVFVARPIVRDGKLLGFSRSSIPVETLDAYIRGVRVRMAWGFLAAVVVALFVAIVISSRIVRPVRALAAGARRLEAGDFDHRIAVTTNDEIGDLAVAFNDMARSLRETIAKLDVRNDDIRLVLDNVHQGLLTVDRHGVMSPECSRSVVDWFGPAEAGVKFCDYIARRAPEAGRDFGIQFEQLMADFLPLELSVDQLPKRATIDGRWFELTYTPILVGDQVNRLLVVATDASARVAAEQREAEQREVAEILEHALRDKPGYLGFMNEAAGQVEALCEATPPPLADTKRLLHTLKGNSAIFGVRSVAILCHRIEGNLEETQGELASEDAALLAAAWTKISSKLSKLLGEAETGLDVEVDEYAEVLRSLVEGAPRGDIAGRMNEWRMERASTRLGRFAEQAKALASRLGKGPIEVEVDAGAIRIARDDLAPFWAAFTHVVRNAVDHGLESVEERTASGKPLERKLRLAARRTADELHIEIADNGRGIDWEAVAARARAAGLPHETSAERTLALFADGLSTRDEVTETSGRGVGLGAVRVECERLGGRIVVTSQCGEGTTLRFSLPASRVSEVVSVKNTIAPLQMSA